MKRLGCFTGKVDGKLTAATKASIHHYLRERELPKGEANVTDVLLKDMKDQSDRVCPIECGRNEIERNGTCVAAPKQKKPAPPMARRQEPARPVARQREPRVASPPPARTPVAAATAPSARPAPKMLGVGF